MRNEKLFEDQMARQAYWLADLRLKLLRKSNLRTRNNILDLGSGSGIIAKELLDKSKTNVTAVDINQSRVSAAKERYPEVNFICADAQNLPFSDNSFDLITSSWLWLWIEDKNKLAAEIKRLLKPGGVYISLAEQDSGATIEYPEELELKKEFFINFVKEVNGDPFVGRKIKSLFTEDIYKVEHGVFSTMFDQQLQEKNCKEDWKQIEDINNGFFTFQEIKRLKELELESIKNKTRFSFNPVFWIYILKVHI